MAFPTLPLGAQAVLPAPMRHMYGVGEKEFYIGAQLACTQPPPESVDYLWNFYNNLGIHMMTYQGYYGNDVNIGPLLASSMRNANPSSPSYNRMVATVEPLIDAGNGSAYEFFPFDSTQSSIFLWKFTQLSTADTMRNADENNLLEQWYRTPTTSPGTMTASGIAFDYNSNQIYRHAQDWDGSAWQSHGDRSQVTDGWARFARSGKSTMDIVATGHIFSTHNTGNDGNTPILRIEVWYEVPYGVAHALTENTMSGNAADNQELLYETYNVKKSDFMPLPGSGQSFNAYHDCVFQVDLNMSSSGLPGPMHEHNISRRFDVRVYWLGAEDVALRSISLRDPIGQLVLGHTADADAYRNSIKESCRYLLTGSRTPGALLREGVIMLSSAIELYPCEDAPTNMVNRLMRDSLGIWNPDTAGLYVFGSTYHDGIRRYHEQIDLPMVMTETLPDKPGNFEDSTQSNAVLYKVPYSHLPSIRQHNGGRPMSRAAELDMSESAVEAYESTLQRMIVGRYGQEFQVYPYQQTWVNAYGIGAGIFRETGRRMLSMIGTNCGIRLKMVGSDLDTAVDHVPEASEIRLNTNLALCYGSRGIEWYWLGSLLNFYNADALAAGTEILQDSFGSNGSRTSDTTQNVMDLYVTRADNSPGMMFPNMYVGWRDRTREIRRVDAWLARVGPELCKLRWRDSYSINGQAAMPGTDDGDPGKCGTRLLPANEIVTSVTARSRAGVIDAAYATYVELGLFDPLLGATHQDDTNHVFVVNRRTFERPDGIDPASTEGFSMDALAESRTIRIQFNLQHPDNSQWNYIRVQEIATDTTRLPQASTQRTGLDTIVHGDSAVELTLRPAGAALLRITYCAPNSRLDSGDLRYNTQRKIVFDGRRFYSVFVKKVKVYVPPAKVVPVVEDQVFMMHSLPVDAATGAVLWDPSDTVLVSDTSHACWYQQNRFPSLTVRADSSRLGDTVVSVVWSSYSCGSPAAHTVLARNIKMLPTGKCSKSVIDSIGLAHGGQDSTWGVPVVSRLHGGEMFAWSDSIVGIVARVRRDKSGGGWWTLPGQYSPPSYVSMSQTSANGAGCYPTVPAFAHIAGRDSSVGLAWQQPVANAGIAIMYQRLVHAISHGADTVIGINAMTVSQGPGYHSMPSLDMTQNVWFGAQEGLTWQENYLQPLGTPLGGIVFHYRTLVHFSSLWTETSRSCDPDSSHPARFRPYWDCIEPTQQWTYNTYIGVDLTNGQSFASLYPNTASLNGRIDSSHQSEQIYFSVSTSRSPWTSMQQAEVEYGTNFVWPQPRDYSIGGYYPNGSASGRRQTGLLAVLYQETPSQGELQTSRQFFAKERPSGYMAQGRRVYFRLSDAGLTSINGALHDAWYASESSSGPLHLVERTDSLARVDSLSQVRGLLRTEYFTAHDSTTIGCELSGRFGGDSVIARGASVLFVAELVDSATNRAIAVLDSFRIGPGRDWFGVVVRKDFNLLSGTYCVRLSAMPDGVTVDPGAHGSLYPVEEIAGWVDGEFAAKYAAVAGAAGSMRIDVAPNPATSQAHLLFSIPEAGETTVRIFNALGREMVRMEGGEMAEGRYDVNLATSDLPAGAYMVELRSGERRSMTKLMVMH
ncbi:MAG: T9SS type A sorting domain-containing protein [Bacteroidetes bacterium]|nr:T9SS type A sorting domain-containing protein [Bacteroidota bacterium]